MTNEDLKSRIARLGLVALCWCALGGLIWPTASAQQPPRAEPAAVSGRAVAPVDVTGYWVSIVTEDWRYRMLTPPKGDYASLPLNAAGKTAVAAWDYAKDIAAGNQCKAYGAAGIIRLPTRLHITWQDDRTLKFETDAGQQTRLFSFDTARRPVPAAMHTAQGASVAEWFDVLGGGRGGRGGAGVSAPTVSRAEAGAYGLGSLKVVTTNLRAGYLRKNGVPYSDRTTVTEIFDRVPGPGNDQWLIVQTTIEDPVYLTRPFGMTTHFRLEPDGAKWHPTPCEVDPPIIFVPDGRYTG